MYTKLRFVQILQKMMLKQVSIMIKRHGKPRVIKKGHFKTILKVKTIWYFDWISFFGGGFFGHGSFLFCSINNFLIDLAKLVFFFKPNFCSKFWFVELSLRWLESYVIDLKDFKTWYSYPKIFFFYFLNSFYFCLICFC